MGRKEYLVTTLTIDRFDLGYFPNLDFNDIPNGGFEDCRHVLHRRSSLRPFPGIDLINSSKADYLTGQGLHYLNVNDGVRRICVFGQSIYDEIDGVLSDITDTVTVGNGNVFQFVDYQLGSNQYAIGAQGGGNPPITISATGNAALLGGSPPNIETIAIYHEIAFGSIGEALYWSGTGAITTWNTTRDVEFFKKDITTIIEHGPKLAVFTSETVGSIQGYDRLDFVKEQSEISNVGCVGKLAATKCFWGESDTSVIATISKDGIYIIDESFGKKKILGNNYFEEFNQSTLSKSSICYWKEENLLIACLPYASSTEPDYLIIINTKTGAFWPGPSIHSNFIKSLGSMRDSSGKEFIFFQDNNGHLFKFNFAANSYHNGEDTESIDYYAKTKRFDLKDIHSMGELVMLADAVGDWGINVGVNFGLSKNDGTSGTITFSNNEDVLGDTFVLGASSLGGSDYIFEHLVGVGGFGRFVQLIFYRQGIETNDLLGQSFVLGSSSLGTSSSFNIKLVELHLHRHRRGGNDR